MRHTFQLTVDYNPDAAQLAWILNHAEAGDSETQTRKAFAKRLVLAVIDQHPELKAVTSDSICMGCGGHLQHRPDCPLHGWG
jgi:hypothetical protein